MTTKVAIIGGGAAGVGLLWSMAEAKKKGLTAEDWDITLIHNKPHVGGHSDSVTETMDGAPRQLDLGVQVIAPAMYPAVTTMLNHPDFSDIQLDEVKLRIACAFPDEHGSSTYWGNFPSYQGTPLYQKGAKDCMTFERIMADVGKDLLEVPMTLDMLLDLHEDKFQDLDYFKTYFLDPYMSIVNGYGQALLSEVLVADVIPLFDWGLGAFTHETTGFKRFRHGAGSWVERMAVLAKNSLGSDLTLDLGTTVTALYTGSGGPTIESRPTSGGAGQTRVFDYVISTVDMLTSAKIMANHEGWEFYKHFIGDVDPKDPNRTTVWDLQPGFCYLHQDDSILAPGIPNDQQETLQFTAPKTPDGSTYDLTKSYTTYIESNLLGLPKPAAGGQYYLTMYGFDPEEANRNGANVPIPKKGVKHHMNWVHGMWLPTFMVEPKLHFHLAQGVSRHATPLRRQLATGIFFAGNNLTMDSEEGALLSGFAVGEYVFGYSSMMTLLPDDLSGHDWKVWAEAEALYLTLKELMFAPHFLSDPGPGPIWQGLSHMLERRKASDDTA